MAREEPRHAWAAEECDSLTGQGGRATCKIFTGKGEIVTESGHYPELLREGNLQGVSLHCRVLVAKEWLATGL